MLQGKDFKIVSPGQPVSNLKASRAVLTVYENTRFHLTNLFNYNELQQFSESNSHADPVVEKFDALVVSFLFCLKADHIHRNRCARNSGNLCMVVGGCHFNHIGPHNV